MQIEYLKYLEENFEEIKKEGIPTKATSIEKIKEMELALLGEGKQFPKAFREYLFLMGNYAPLDIGISDEWLVKASIMLKDDLKERGIEMTRPIVIVKELYSKIFGIIYLDEGDDPQPWNCSIDKGYDSDDGEIIWKMPFSTFGEMIKAFVDLRLARVRS
ncbi:hypothetical protein [Aquimarina rhabdastrellae]